MRTSPAEPLAAGTAEDPDLVLLRLLCVIAWCDGTVSEKERELLETLASEVLLAKGDREVALEQLSQLMAHSQALPLLDQLIPQIQGHDQQQLALKLAFMVIRISQEPGEASSINVREKIAYRRLVEGLGLPDGEVQEAEWAAEQDLRQHTSLWHLLTSRFSRLGAWPSEALLANPELPRL